MDLSSDLQNMKDKFFPFVRDWVYSINEWWQVSSKIIRKDDYDPVLDFSGLIAILAFALAIYTLEQPKYRIRQATAIIPIKNTLFCMLVVFGFILFLIEAAIRFEWQIYWIIEPNAINLAFAACIAILTAYWMMICFLRPQKYNFWTAPRFFDESFRGIINGTEQEILALANELLRELDKLIAHYPKKASIYDGMTKTEEYTYDIFELIEDPRFCQIVAKNMPSFPAHFVDLLVKGSRFDTPAPAIIRRIVIAMLSDKKSALFVENEWLASGYTGLNKPITKSIFRNWSKFESSSMQWSSPLDLSYPHAQEWDADGWRVYFGMAAEYINGIDSHVPLTQLNGVKEILRTMEIAYRRPAKNNQDYEYSDPKRPDARIRIANKFLHEIVEFADKRGERVYFDRNDKYFNGNDFSSQIAVMLEESIMYTASIEGNDFYQLWQAQHNDFWYMLQDHKIADSPTMKSVRRKIRRTIWEEVKRMDGFPNYKGAKYVRLILFVEGFYTEDHRNNVLKHDYWPLVKVISKWLQKNYRRISNTHPPVAEAMLPIGFRYDNNNIIREKGDTLTGKAKTSQLKVN